jgi:hypothetical protein
VGGWNVLQKFSLVFVLQLMIVFVPACGQPRAQVRPQDGPSSRSPTTRGRDAQSSERPVDFSDVVASRFSDVPCRGLEVLGRDASVQAWQILGDRNRGNDWHDVVLYFGLIGDRADLERLIDFAHREFATNSGTSPLVSEKVRAVYMSPLSVALIARRLSAKGDRDAEPLAFQFLLRCADPRSWTRRVDPASEANSADPQFVESISTMCLQSMGYISGPVADKQPQVLRARLIGVGVWTDRMEGGFREAALIREQVNRSPDFSDYLASTVVQCPGF